MKKLFSILMVLFAFLSLGFTKVDAAEIKAANAMHILVPTEQQAIEIRNEILQGETQMAVFNNFRNAAKKYSKCPSGLSGGGLGWFGKGDMVPAFEQAAFTIPAGQVSEPVKTQFGWHLIYVISKK